MERVFSNDELMTCAIRSKPKEKKTVLVPKVQAMTDYILKHHKQLILNAVNKGMENGRFGKTKKARLCKGDWSYRDMNFWRYSRTILLVDVILNLYMDTDMEAGESHEVYCELWVHMNEGMTFQPGECGLLHFRPAREMWMLDRYLIPLLRKDEIEQGALELLYAHGYSLEEDEALRKASDLAASMGLSIEYLPLYQRNSTMSMLFFCEGTLEVLQVGSDDTNGSGHEKRAIPANTIVINTQSVSRDYSQLDIYHECIHYDWHYMFYRLQDMHNNDIHAMNKTRVVVMDGKEPVNPLKWMEWQARRGSFALMMPQKKMALLLEKQEMEPAYHTCHIGERLDWKARCIARECKWPKFRVRARMMQLGNIAAKGILNFVDGAYIAPFAFSSQNGDGDYSFVIDREKTFELYRADPTFRERIQSGKYVFVDGHICVNDPRFVRSTVSGLKLTPWANAHVDTCCLRFVNVYEQCGIGEYIFGVMNSDEEYNKHYLSFVTEDRGISARKSMDMMRRIKKEMPDTFHDALKYLMSQAGVTIEQLEEKSRISTRTLSRLRNTEKDYYNPDELIALCVALHVPPWLSERFLQLAGFTWRENEQHDAYRMILDCMFMDRIEDVQKFLLSANCRPLKLNDTLAS